MRWARLPSSVKPAKGITEGQTRKHRNKPTEADGILFHSKREAKRYGELMMLQGAGRIRALKCQVKYRFDVNGVFVASLKVDFTYEELQRDGQWAFVAEDVKGYANDRWPMKKRLMLACHGIKVRET